MDARSCLAQRWVALALTLACGCAGSVPKASTNDPSSPALSIASSRGEGQGMPAPVATETAVTTFVADFSTAEIGAPFNLFGVANGNRIAKGGPDGLSLEIRSAEKAWDAVGVRTARVKVDGDFDLRGAFKGFAGAGNASAKLLVVDAASTRGEAAYVERIRIDGKDLYKFGGEVEGSLENWGFVEASGTAGELRITRKGGVLRALSRADDNVAWAEFAPPQPAPKSMPRVVKVGVKLSAASGRSAAVTWTMLAVDGNIIRVP